MWLQTTSWQFRISSVETRLKCNNHFSLLLLHLQMKWLALRHFWFFWWFVSLKKNYLRLEFSTFAIALESAIVSFVVFLFEIYGEIVPFWFNLNCWELLFSSRNWKLCTDDTRIRAIADRLWLSCQKSPTSTNFNTIHSWQLKSTASKLHWSLSWPPQMNFNAEFFHCFISNF